MKDRYTFAVAGACSGVGVSFTAMRIAYEHSSKDKTSLVELGHPYFYSSLGMEKRFILRGFSSYADMLRNKESLRKFNNESDGINWAVLKPDERAVSEPELYRIINNMPGEFIVFDCSGLSEDVLLNILPEMDEVLIVIDPLPTKLMAGKSLLEKLRLYFPKAEILVNKMNPSVHKSELSRFLGTKNFSEYELLNEELIYKAEYSCTSPFKILKNT